MAQQNLVLNGKGKKKIGTLEVKTRFLKKFLGIFHLLGKTYTYDFLYMT